VPSQAVRGWKGTHAHIELLEIPEMRVELKRIIDEEVLDMGFEEEVISVLKEWHGKGKSYYNYNDFYCQRYI
jgi:hypothetical protein